MDLWEARVEVRADDAEAAELALLESGFGGWSLLEDAVAKRAWIVGVFEGEAEAAARWVELRAALPVEPLGAFLPRLLEQDEGHIVNTASRQGLLGSASAGAYATSKFGIVGLSEVLDAELRDLGSRVGVSV